MDEQISDGVAAGLISLECTSMRGFRIIMDLISAETIKLPSDINCD